MKLCVDCQQDKPVDQYHRSGRGLRLNCKPCRSKRDREDKLKRFYNITSEEYDRLLLTQNGLCKICRRAERLIDTRTGEIMSLAVDHDHSCCPGTKTCGQCIRGLLCSSCNTALGLLDDDIDHLVRSILYLRGHL